MPGPQASLGCCDRCPKVVSADGPATANAAAVARRRLLKAAVFRPQAGTASRSHLPAGQDWLGGGEPVRPDTTGESGFADAARLPRTVSGTVVDVSPHVLVLGDAGSEQRLILTPDALAWRGVQLEPAGLHQGDHAVVRLRPSARNIADRIWANVGRVTGVITERSGSTLVVDEGATRKPQVITIRPRAVGRIQVRFPTLEPGYLVDIIGLRHGAELDAVLPATSQPGYPVDAAPRSASHERPTTGRH